MIYTPAFVAMALANFFVLCSFSMYYLFPLFISKGGGNQADIGIIMGAFTLSSVLCRPIISEMIDRIGRKRSFTLGTVIMSVLPFAYLLFPEDRSSFYPSLLLIRIVHGVGLAVCITSAFTYAADLVPHERLNEGIGAFGISGLTGMAVGPILAEFIIRESGFNMVFIAAAGLAGLALLIQLPLPDGYARESSAHPHESFFSVLKTRRVSIIALVACLFGFGLAASSHFVSPYASQLHLKYISLYYVAYSGAAILSRLLGGRMADRVGEARVIPYALGLTGGGLLILVFLGSEATLALSGLLTGSGHGFLFPSLNALAVREVPARVRGKITGVFTGSIDAGVFGGSIMLGFVGEWAGFQSLFLLAGLALLSGLGVIRLHGFAAHAPETRAAQSPNP